MEDGNMQADIEEIRALRREVAELRGSVQDLVIAWNTAQGVVRFFKWLGGIATAATALWALIELAVRHRS